MNWRDDFAEAAATGCKVSIITRTGHAIVSANWAADQIEEWDALRGLRWHEFIHPDDLPRLIAWLAEPTAGAPIVYRGIGLYAGRAAVVRVCLVKRPVAGVWLVVGEQEFHAASLPGFFEPVPPFCDTERSA